MTEDSTPNSTSSSSTWTPHQPPTFLSPEASSNQSQTWHSDSTRNLGKQNSSHHNESQEILSEEDNHHDEENLDELKKLSKSISRSKSRKKQKIGQGREKENNPSQLERASSRLSRQSSEPNYPSSALPLARTRTQPTPGVEYIDWEEDDKENPFNWSNKKKWTTVLACFFFAMSTAINATGYSMAEMGATGDLNASHLQFTSGSTTYLTAIAFTPMALAPLSEVFGRKPIYLASAVVFILTYLPQALAPNITSIIISRFFQGMAASTGNSLVAGTCSDVFYAEDRGTSMMLFSLLIFVGQSLGPVTSGYIAMYIDGGNGWRWIFWIGLIIGIVSLGLMLCFLDEPRGPVILSKRAARLSKETGKAYRTYADDERASFSIMIKTSLVRPFKYLFTEPVVLALSLWVGMAWATIFLLISSVPIVFREYGWTQSQIGLVFLTIAVGGAIGWIGNLHQERLYHQASIKHHGKPPPEARLYWSMFGALLFPAALFFFAWSGQPSVHPAAPIVSLVLINAGVYWIYVSIFSYVADCYERYASSGLAAQSFARNILAAFFPLFVKPFYENLGPPVASSILGGVALALGVCPFILFKFGDRIRKASKVVQQLEKDAEEQKKEEDSRREALLKEKEKGENIAKGENLQ